MALVRVLCTPTPIFLSFCKRANSQSTYQQRNDCLLHVSCVNSLSFPSTKLFQSICAKISKCARNRQKDSSEKGHILALGTGYHPWPKDFANVMKLKSLGWRDSLHDLCSPHVIAVVLKGSNFPSCGWRARTTADRPVRGSVAVFLTDGGHEPWNVGGSRSWKRYRTGSSSGVSRKGDSPADILISACWDKRYTSKLQN